MSAPSEEFQSRYGPWAVITGASSGIGEQFARALAARGLKLVLIARREERLRALAGELVSAHGTECVVVRADLSTDAGLALATAAIDQHDAGLVVANAGFGLKGAFLEIPLERQREMVRLNCDATLVLAHHAGAKLKARGRGGLIITASAAALQGMPLTAAYAASKSFELLLAEALWDELKPFGVDVQALCPGSTDTEGPRRTGVDNGKVPGGMMPPAVVVAASLAALGKSPVVIPGWQNVLAAFGTRLLPRATVTRIAGRIVRRVTGR